MDITWLSMLLFIDAIIVDSFVLKKLYIHVEIRNIESATGQRNAKNRYVKRNLTKARRNVQNPVARGIRNALANYLVVEYLTNRDYSLSGSLTPQPRVHPCFSLAHERNQIITRSNCNVHDILPILPFGK